MSQAETWTVARLLQWTTDFLKRHGSESPRLDAEVLLANALGWPRIQLYAAFEHVPNEHVRAAFRDMVRCRSEGTPVAYLVGQREFYSLAFRVTSDVLIPRPETEFVVMTLIDLARRKAGLSPGKEQAIEPNTAEEKLVDPQTPPPAFETPVEAITICDVGTGSGIIAVAAAKHIPNSRVLALDVCPAALEVARSNAQTHGVAERIEFLESDLFSAAPAGRKFDFIASNPPYVSESEMKSLAPDVQKFEPRQALVAGPRGTEVIERLVPQAAERLQPGGYLLLEISPMIHDAVLAVLAADGRFEPGSTIKDLARLPRVVQACRK